MAVSRLLNALKWIYPERDLKLMSLPTHLKACAHGMAWPGDSVDWPGLGMSCLAWEWRGMAWLWRGLAWVWRGLAGYGADWLGTHAGHEQSQARPRHTVTQATSYTQNPAFPKVSIRPQRDRNVAAK